ncbi:hypothetical protein V1525DRAFT_138465 [Lipomyces kononenkoae]|uniref:Uncharacterized protein n=1 Tax=Lipomyces kononenkoae TaxID=34357 RepID=A0ACC3TAR2_LIPKO
MPSPGLTSLAHMPQPSYSPELAPFQPLSPPDSTKLSSSVSVTNGGSSTSSPPNSASFPLRVKNLPKDLSKREFNLIFTFAKDYITSDLLHVPQDDNPVGGSSLIGIAYFKSYSASVEAHDVLDSRSYLFYEQPNVAANSPTSHGSSPSSAASSPSYYTPIKCEFPELKVQPMLSSSFDQHHLPHHSSISGPPSHHAYAPLPSTSGASASTGQFASVVSSFPGLNGLPSLATPPGQPTSAAKSASRFNFPFEPLSPTSPAAAPPVPEPEFYQDLNMFAPSSTSPRGTFSSGPGELQRVSGKSMLLESAGRDNEEYEDIVKDPLSWMRANGATTSPQIPGQPPQVPPPVPQQQWQPDRVRRNTGTSAVPTQAFTNLSLNPNQPPAFPAPGATPATPRSTLAPAGATPVSAASQTATPQGSGPAPSASTLHALQNGGRVLPPANPADQNPPCNTLYVGNLPMNTSEDELKALFSRQRGYKRLCFRTKMNGPMCFVEFEDVAYATRALTELYGRGLSNSVKGGIRLSFSKNPLGVRSNSSTGASSGNTGGTNQATNGSTPNGGMYPQHHHQHSQAQAAQPQSGPPGQLGGIPSVPMAPIMPPQGVHPSQQVPPQQQAPGQVHPSTQQKSQVQQQPSQQQQQVVQQPQPISLGSGMGIGMGIGTGV